MSFFHLLESLFTCFLKDKTLHNHWDYAGFTVPYYNIPSNNRELQLSTKNVTLFLYYNIPSNNRELQRPSLKRLQLCIITYQVITGNYSINSENNVVCLIITYQVITGNYSCTLKVGIHIGIITYQVITGNYSWMRYALRQFRIITYQVITGNYSWID